MAKGLKTGGREQGTPNKISKELREKITDFLNLHWEQVEKDFLILEPEKRILLYEKLLQFSLPKLQTIALPIKTEKIIENIILTDEQVQMIINEL